MSDKTKYITKCLSYDQQVGYYYAWLEQCSSINHIIHPERHAVVLGTDYNANQPESAFYDAINLFNETHDYAKIHRNGRALKNGDIMFVVTYEEDSSSEELDKFLDEFSK